MEENKRTTELEKADADVIAKAAVAVLIEKKALDVRLFDVQGVTTMTDYYVNATGRSSTQVAALADEVVYQLGLKGRRELRVEGRGGNSWLLVDYGSVIVNIFDREARDYYNFDRLLPCEKECDISDIVKAIDEKYSVN